MTSSPRNERACSRSIPILNRLLIYHENQLVAEHLRRYDRHRDHAHPDQAYKHWARLFNNDSTLTSAVLDRVLHHAETVIIEGKSYRTKDHIDEE